MGGEAPPLSIDGPSAAGLVPMSVAVFDETRCLAPHHSLSCVLGWQYRAVGNGALARTTAVIAVAVRTAWQSQSEV